MYINLNNVKLYYEVYGEGKPIILLHGNSETHEIFDKLIEKLSYDYKVYAIDSRCHGKSENVNNITYDLMAKDVIEFIKKLEISNPILYGFSDGGIVGLLIAIKEPKLLSKLIVSGVNITPDAIAKYFIIISKIAYFFTKNKLIRLMIKEPNIPIEDLKKILIPVHLLVGEKDVIKLNHTNLIKNNISNSSLEIVKNENHGSYIIHSDKIYNILKKYI